jgi:glutamate dehydrogenase/leucine dehydrogenase
LADSGVLYAPDFVVNAGGVINIAEEPAGYDHDRAWRRIAGIGATLHHVLDRAESDRITPAEAADRLAVERIEAISRIGRIRTSREHMPQT